MTEDVPRCKNGHEIKFFPNGTMSCDEVFYNMEHRDGKKMVPDCDQPLVSVFDLYREVKARSPHNHHVHYYGGPGSEEFEHGCCRICGGLGDG